MVSWFTGTGQKTGFLDIILFLNIIRSSYFFRHPFEYDDTSFEVILNLLN